MKFLVFNLAVAAALGYLFFADRGQVQETAGRVHDAAQDLRTFARQAYEKAPQLVQGLEPAREPAHAAEVAAAAAPEPAPEPPKPATPAGEPITKPSLSATTDAIPSPPPVARLTPDAAATAPIQLVPKATGTRAIQLLPDSAVAARRREVLEGRPPSDATPALRPGERLMSPSERRKELLTLAEEMDLFYARSVSR